MKTLLNVKTNYSLLKSLISIDELLLFAQKHQFKVLSIADENLFAIMEFVNKCSQNNIKSVFGLEVICEDKTLVLYPKNYQGYENLLKINTYVTKKELTISKLTEYKENLIIISLDSDFTMNHSDLYYGFSDKNQLEELIPKKAPYVFFRPVYYLKNNDYKTYNYLQLLKNNQTIMNNEIVNENYSYQENTELYSNKEGLFNIDKILDQCNVVFPKNEIHLPKYDEKIINSDEYLYQLSKKGLEKRFKTVDNKYLVRLEDELKVIISMGYADYFLIVYDFIRYAKKKNILVGPGRGSAAGSLVAYCLGITEVDPLKYGLIFERFLNKERITMPDIDTDFPDIYRDEIIDYVINRYGEKRVARIITFGTFGPKMAIRDFGKVLNIPEYKLNNISKFLTNNKFGLKDYYEKNERFRVLINEDSKLKELYEIALIFEGFPKHHSKHAAGIVISNKDLDNTIPLIKVADQYLSAYSMKYLENLGLLKMDFLAVKNLTTIMDIINDINTYEKIKINFNDIDLNDEKTFSLFQKGDTNGIFQFESNGMKEMLTTIKPNSFKEVYNAIALYRPGAMNGIDKYLTGKNNEIELIDQSLEEILNDTYGVIIYQEQVMNIFRKVANYSLGEADLLRRAISKKQKQILVGEKDKFIKRGLENNYKMELLEKLFDLIIISSDYSFPKAHAVSYALISYKMAYLKVHYPKYFYRNLLNSAIGSVVKTSEYIMEAKKHNLSIQKPNINISGETYIIEKNSIYYPLINIKGINNTVVSDLVAKRVKYNDIFEVAKDLENRFLTKEIFTNLIHSGALDNSKYNHRTMIENLDIIINYGEIVKDLGIEMIKKPVLKDYPEYDNFELSRLEKELYGFYFSNHPSANYRSENKAAIYLDKLDKSFNKEVLVLALIEEIKVIDTKKGEKMAFVTISDETAKSEVVLFPKTYLNNANLMKNQVVKIIGNVERRENRYQIIARKIESI